MEMYELVTKNSKNHLKEAQWDAREHRQLDEIRKIHEQNEKLNKEIKTIKNNQTENLGAEEYNGRTKKVNQEIQQQKKNQVIWN